MKLWNRILCGQTKCFNGDFSAWTTLADTVRGLPVVLADDVATWFDEVHGGKQRGDFLNSFCARSPFDDFLMEFKTWRGHCGLFVCRVPEVPHQIAMIFGIDGPRGFWVTGSVHIQTDESGRLLNVTDTQNPGAPIQLRPSPQDDWLLLFPVNVGLAALTFMNCRNVSLREQTPAPKLRKAFERRRGVKPARYYVLDIKPLRKAIGAGPGSGISLAKALHLCRGHFKEFSEEKPLFGKLAGRFWWSPQLRGDADVGTVTKDYRVHPPDGGAA